MQFILGSQSSRRKEILNFFDLPFIQIASNFDEDSILFLENPKNYAQTLANEKAVSLAKRFPSSPILTADTIVYKDAKVYGKPKNKDEAYRFLRELSGGWHHVFTALALKKGDLLLQAVEETKVEFNSLNDEQIQLYHQKLDLSDKAGGYRVQGAGSLAIKSIQGCYYNVMGLPINSLQQLLKQIGIDLWDHLKE